MQARADRVRVDVQPVPLVDLRAQHELMREELEAVLEGVISSGRFVLGDQLSAFEEEFAAYCGVEQCVGLASGTDALVLTLRACGIGPGDEVITPSLTFFAAPFAIASVGATPVFVDVEAATATLDPDHVREALGPRTRAIVPTHLYGRTADVRTLATLAAERGLWLIEDAAQAHGARAHGRMAGSVGQVGCFSFYPSKNLGALGDGGAVVTSDQGLADRLRLMRNYGQREKYRHEKMGGNSRLDELQAAVLRKKLPRLDEWNAARVRAAESYGAQLDPSACPPIVGENGEHVFHLYVIRAPQRDALRTLLSQNGVETGIHYPIPAHRQPAFRKVPHVVRDLQVTDRLAQSVLSLPMFPTISDGQIRYVSERVTAGLNELAASPGGQIMDGPYTSR